MRLFMWLFPISSCCGTVILGPYIKSPQQSNCLSIIKVKDLDKKIEGLAYMQQKKYYAGGDGLNGIFTSYDNLFGPTLGWSERMDVKVGLKLFTTCNVLHCTFQKAIS